MPFKQILTLILFLCSFVTLRVYSQSENSNLVKDINQLAESGDSIAIDSTQVADSLKVTQNSMDISSREFDSLFVKIDTIKKPPRVQIGSLLSRLLNNSKDYSIELEKLRLILADIPDTAMLNKRVPELKESVNQLQEITINWEGEVNLRYLKGVENYLNFIEEEKVTFDKIIVDRMGNLLQVGEKIDEIRSDSLINLTLRDSTSLPQISKELKRLKTNIREIDSTLVIQELDLTRIQANISDLSIEILYLNKFFKESEKKIKQNYWKKEANYLWEKSNQENQPSLESVFLNSELTNLFVLKTYLSRYYPLFLGFSAFMLIAYFATKRIINNNIEKKEHADLILDRTQILRKNLFISFIVMGIPFYFLMVKNPPMAFISILSVVMAFFSIWIIKSHFYQKLLWKLIVFFPLFIFASFIALNWRISLREQPFVYLIALGTILLSGLIFKDINGKKFSGSSVLKFLIIFSITFSVFSLILNIFGRFSLAKIFAISGLTGFYRGIALYAFIQVVLKTFYLWIEASKKSSDSFTSFFDFQEIQKRLQGVLNIFAFSLWLYAIVYHLGLFDPIYDSVLSFISEERTLGNATFTFGTIILFFLILIVSQFLANSIAYFASIKDQQYATSRKKRLGSSVLIIRLFIITIGFIIAMTAAKIPIDKITIVLGALSVGIGFGLQTIINNLVSGIILAFERPIQIGDEIVVGVNAGTVKEVGIRASKIRAYDGSEIVIPNGDLLSQSLINWTLSDKRRRIELIIGVGYTSDMKKVHTVLENVLKRDRILKAPAPSVYMQNFGESSVDFRLLFWVDNIDIWINLRAEVMFAIFEAFSENDIEIPFPKRDLYIKGMPDLIQEKVSGPKQKSPPNQEENT